MSWRTLAALTALSLLATYALAQDGCRYPECADDQPGNEVLVWNVSEGAAYYLVELEGDDGTFAPCARVPQRYGFRGRPLGPVLFGVAPGRCARPYGDRNARLRVRACDHVDACSPLSQFVEIEPHRWRCFTPAGEVECWSH